MNLELECGFNHIGVDKEIKKYVDNEPILTQHQMDALLNFEPNPDVCASDELDDDDLISMITDKIGE